MQHLFYICLNTTVGKVPIDSTRLGRLVDYQFSVGMGTPRHAAYKKNLIH